MKRIAIYCDLSKSSGFGHLNRMKSLSKELQKKGSKCYFLLCEQNKQNIIKYSSSFKAIFFSKKNKIKSISKILLENNIQILIIDSYENNLLLEKVLVRQNFFVVSIDDHLKKYNSNIVVTNRISENHLIKKKPNQIWLTGNKYILVSKYDNFKKKFQNKAKTFKLLLHAGGSSSYKYIKNFTEATLEAAKAYNLDTTILCTTKESQFYIKKLLNKKSKINKIKIVKFIKNLPQKVKNYHIVAGPMGTTTLETILAGSFPFSVPIKNDGRDSLNSWRSIGHFAHLTNLEKKNKIILANMWNLIIENYDELLKKLKKRSKKLDGLGPKRLAKKIIFYYNIKKKQK
jgi:spore coat polysaccharide biosynthesis predicted glycosyltransferase SpsG